MNENVVSALAAGLNAAEKSRRVGWAKYFEAEAAADESFRNLNVAKGDIDLYRKAASTYYGIAWAVLAHVYGVAEAQAMMEQNFPGDDQTALLDSWVRRGVHRGKLLVRRRKTRPDIMIVPTCDQAGLKPGQVFSSGHRNYRLITKAHPDEKSVTYVKCDAEGYVFGTAVAKSTGTDKLLNNCTFVRNVKSFSMRTPEQRASARDIKRRKKLPLKPVMPSGTPIPTGVPIPPLPEHLR
jgi:hypothetical protein